MQARVPECPRILEFVAWLFLTMMASMVAFAQTGSQTDQSGPWTKGQQPLYLQSDELIYDTRADRVIARGKVEIYHDNYILTADQVTYDQNANTLTAEGNAQLKAPDGSIVGADKLVASNELRDAFVRAIRAASE